MAIAKAGRGAPGVRDRSLSTKVPAIENPRVGRDRYHARPAAATLGIAIPGADGYKGTMGVRVTTGLLLAALLLAPLACASWRGARLYQSGSAALERGEVATAIAQLEEAALLVPEASEIQNHLGLAYAQATRWPDARVAFERAVEIDCQNEAARENLAASRRVLSRGAAPEESAR